MRSAGNTFNPCLLAIRAKGYEIKLWFIKHGDDEYMTNWDAEKEGQSFSATTPQELLGLIAMWEVRGDDWQTGDEPNIFDELYPQSKTYDSNGNVIEIGDDEVS